MNKKRPLVGETLAAWMTEQDLSANQLARETGVPQPTITRILRGQSKDPDTATLQPLATRFGKTVAELRGEVVRDSTLPDYRAGYSSVQQQGAALARVIPLIAWGDAEGWRAALNDSSKHTERYPCPIDCSPDTFALRIEGVSMEPRFRSGEIIFIDPRVAPRHDCFVLVTTTSDSQAKLKNYVVEGGEAWLRSTNPHWPEPIAKVTDGVSIIGVVIFKGERL